MKKILLLGAGGNAGQNFTKCIHESDEYEVIGCDIDPYKLETALTPIKYLIDPVKKADQLKEIFRLHNISMVHAQPDSEVKWLIWNDVVPQKLKWGYDHRKWDEYSDKALTSRIFHERFGLKAKSYTLRQCAENEELFYKMQKQAGKVWVRARTGAGSKAALPVSDLKHAISWANYWECEKGLKFDQFMCSEYLPGEEYAVQFFFVNGEVIHSFARERVVSFFANVMPSGQSSTPFVQRTTTRSDVYDRAEQAIRLFEPKPHGVYGVDLKTSFRDELVPTEINYGRFFSTSSFPASLGINTPLAYVDFFTKGSIDYSIRDPRDQIYYEFRGLDQLPIVRTQNDIQAFANVQRYQNSNHSEWLGI